jgi:hypothetical protein
MDARIEYVLKNLAWFPFKEACLKISFLSGLGPRNFLSDPRFVAWAKKNVGHFTLDSDKIVDGTYALRKSFPMHWL